MFDALRRASANSIAAVIPYFGYGRQDRKVAPRTPLTAKLLADLLAAAGASRIISVDLHAGQIQGFTNLPFDHLYAAPVLVEDMKKKFDPAETVIVSPDAGGTERARAYSKRLGCSLAMVDKRRPKPNVAEIMNIIGDVSGKVAVILDDMVDTAGTLTLSAKGIKDKGAVKVYAYATHAVLSGKAIERLAESPIESLTVTDTIPLRENARACGKVRALSIAPLVGEAMSRIHSADSVSSLFV